MTLGTTRLVLALSVSQNINPDSASAMITSLLDQPLCFATAREYLFYWGSVIWHGMGVITVEVHCFHSVSSDMKCSSEDSFESCLSTFDKAPHASSAVLLSDVYMTMGQRDVMCVGWREVMREAASGVILVLCLGKVLCMWWRSVTFLALEGRSFLDSLELICCGLCVLM